MHYPELAELYKERIFTCHRCQQKLMNPYIHANPKHDPPASPGYPLHRQSFQLEYIASKRDVKIVFVGEAPGLDGCGFGGIAFTGEYNAVCQLGLNNYHGTQANWQKEQSANLIYGALGHYCQDKGCTIARAATHIYLTNSVMCVPLGENGRSITAPAKATKEQCRDNLIRQIEILRPQLVIALGTNALSSVAEAFGLTIKGKLTEIVNKQERYSGPGFELVPEIHPSPRNRVLGELYTNLPARLTSIFADYLD